MILVTEYYIGFDPGGVGSFGWAVAAGEGAGIPTIVATGEAPNARVALEAAGQFVGDGRLAAAGIDAPLFWTPTGVRRADARVRRELHARGAPSPGGTVQQLNSLRGACLVQGVVGAMLLRRRWPLLPITETHPKALLWLLGLAHRERHATLVSVRELSQLVIASVTSMNEHERDASVACGAAYAFSQRLPDWHDLVPQEPEYLSLLPDGVAYWMPGLAPEAAA